MIVYFSDGDYAGKLHSQSREKLKGFPQLVIKFACNPYATTIHGLTLQVSDWGFPGFLISNPRLMLAVTYPPLFYRCGSMPIKTESSKAGRLLWKPFFRAGNRDVYALLITVAKFTEAGTVTLENCLHGACIMLVEKIANCGFILASHQGDFNKGEWN